MTELRFGSKRVEESPKGVLTSLATLMKREFFGLATLSNRLELLRDLVQSFVPTNPLPFAFAPLADSRRIRKTRAATRRDDVGL